MSEDFQRALLAADRDVDTRFRDRPADQAVLPCPLQHWVEVVLVQEGAPAEGARCRVLLPDGTTRESALNGRGRLRIEHIVAGECRVSFPDFDADADANGDDASEDDSDDEGTRYVPGSPATVQTDAVHVFHLPSWSLVEVSFVAPPTAAAPPLGGRRTRDDDADDEWEVDAVALGD